VKPGDILAEKNINFVLLGIVIYSSNGMYVIENARTYTESIAEIINSLRHYQEIIIT